MTTGIFVHDLGSREVRVRFDIPVPEAQDPSSYVFTSTAYIPSIVNVAYYDANMTSVKITFDAALTNGQTYSCQVIDLVDVNGTPVTSTPFDFVATDIDRPIILGAYQSKSGCIDVICDRPVGQTSTGASANINSSVGPPSSMVLVPWSPDLNPNSVRFSYSSAPAGPDYIIEFSDIEDVSGNVCESGTIPVELAYNASSYAELIQAEVIHAFVADINGTSGFTTAVIRVFFNCPMLEADVLNTSKWAIDQSGAHTAGDTGNQITAADAVDDPSFISLTNDAKAMMNAHLTSHAHLIRDFVGQITTADAIDYDTASDLTDEICDVYTSHCTRIDMHLYADRIHNLDTSITYPMDKINDMKSKFNTHILELYALEFSNSYDHVGPIVNFASSDNASIILDKFTWFADLHVFTDSTQASFLVTYTGISNEDMSSSVTGDIEVAPLSSQSNTLSMSRCFRGVTIRMDSDINLQDSGRLCYNGTPISFVPSVRSSLPVLIWAFNNVLRAYEIHISDPAIYPQLSAIHRHLDTVNTVDSGNYVTVMDLSILISKANILKRKINAHVISESYHHGRDITIDTPDATDIESLDHLILDIRTRLSNHNSSGIQSRFGMFPSTLAYHTQPGANIISAIMHDLIFILYDGAINGVQYNFTAPIVKSWFSDYPRAITKQLSENFVAVDNQPILTSAVARPGFSSVSPSDHLVSDMVELYMSKPMRNQTVAVGTNISMTGSIVMIDAGWLNNRTISVHVTNMSSILYSVEASNLCDIAGNYMP